MKKIILAFTIIAVAISAYAEQLQGTVVNQKGKPIKNIRVYCTNTKVGANTSQDGSFLLENVNSTDTIAVCPDKKQEARFVVANLSNITVTIDKKNFYINDGHDQTKHSYVKINTKRRPLNVITRAQIEESNAESIYDLLRGRLAGVQVTYGNNGPMVIIRGANSFKMNNEPIFVVDGMVYGNSSDVDNGLNVKDIEKVEVSKEGLDYGVRGANGAIVITTMKGSRSKK